MKKAKSRFTKPVVKKEVENKHTSYIYVPIGNPRPVVYPTMGGITEEEARHFLSQIPDQFLEAEKAVRETGISYLKCLENIILINMVESGFDPLNLKGREVHLTIDDGSIWYGIK